MAEVRAWRASTIPDDAVPLDAEDLVRLLRAFVSALSIDRSVVSDFTVNTIHYYRRKDIIDPPDGRTAAARYRARHLWQIAAARLAGHLGLVTLAEARETMRAANDDELIVFLAARVADARARNAVRGTDPGPPPGTSLPAAARPLPGATAAMIPLPGDAWCVVPESHEAHRSPRAAAELARALATALKTNRSR